MPILKIQFTKKVYVIIYTTYTIYKYIATQSLWGCWFTHYICRGGCVFAVRVYVSRQLHFQHIWPNNTQDTSHDLGPQRVKVTVGPWRRIPLYWTSFCFLNRCIIIFSENVTDGEIFSESYSQPTRRKIITGCVLRGCYLEMVENHQTEWQHGNCQKRRWENKNQVVCAD